MKSIKCPNCGSVSSATQSTCKRCGVSLNNANNSESTYNSRKPQNAVFATNLNSAFMDESETVKKDAWKKIKWGLLIAIIGFALTTLTIYLGKFPNLAAGETGKKIVALFSLITLLPLAVVLAGIIELISGVSIFKIIEKWEELPQWLGWLIGISVFLLFITLIMVVAAVIIFNFF
jgi:hypothetical protein